MTSEARLTTHDLASEDLMEQAARRDCVLMLKTGVEALDLYINELRSKLAQPQAERNSAEPCPYIKDGACELAEPGLRVLEAKWKDAEREAGDWKHQAEMFARAWQRELGGRLINKTHLIDALVLTTQRIVRERAEFEKQLVELRKGIEARLVDAETCNRKANEALAACSNRLYVEQLKVDELKKETKLQAEWMRRMVALAGGTATDSPEAWGKDVVELRLRRCQELERLAAIGGRE